MTHALVLLLALLIGVIAGLRAFTAPAVMAWAAFLHWINLSGTWASWVGHWATVDRPDDHRGRRTGHRPDGADPEPQDRRRSS